jgi:Cys-tRNA(Pro)/Cys-tRNA(Cys) deacylase
VTPPASGSSCCGCRCARRCGRGAIPPRHRGGPHRVVPNDGAQGAPAVRRDHPSARQGRVHPIPTTTTGRGVLRRRPLALGVDPGRVFKTLFVSADGAAVGWSISGRSTKAVAVPWARKKAVMAEPAMAERASAAVAGSPGGPKRPHPTVVDESALAFETVFVSGGRRAWTELAPPTCSASPRRRRRIGRAEPVPGRRW